MSDLLSTLAQQTLGIAPVVQRVTSRFGPAPLILADARLALPAPSEPSPWGPAVRSAQRCRCLGAPLLLAPDAGRGRDRRRGNPDIARGRHRHS
ncbi:MAG: hypothetical protein HZY76_02785 [Anaerolineae bacterium]|nr:MAG: hypothetical protein HZY76_02785 [Anaerolineae bacterium]